MPARIREGDKAPDFTLTAQDGKSVSMHEYLGKKCVVLYFYPKDFTMGCTAETRTFGDSYRALTELGAEVIGVSADSVESHQEFAQECGAGFPLASDGDGAVREMYGVRPSMGLFPGRVTFVIDRQGIIRKIYSSQLNPKKHVSIAIETLRSLV